MAIPAASEAQPSESDERTDTGLTVEFLPDDRQGAQDQWYWIDLEGTIQLENLEFGEGDRISISVFAGDWSQLQLKVGLGSEQKLIFTSSGYGGFELEQIDQNQFQLHFQRRNLMQTSALEDPLDQLPISVRVSSVGQPPEVLDVTVTKATIEIDTEPPHPVSLRAELPENALFDGQPNTLELYLRGAEVPPGVCPDLRLDVTGDAASVSEPECRFDDAGTTLLIDLTGTRSGGSARVNAVVVYPGIGPTAVAFTVQIVDAPANGFFGSPWVIRLLSALIFIFLLAVAVRILRRQPPLEGRREETDLDIPTP